MQPPKRLFRGGVHRQFTGSRTANSPTCSGGGRAGTRGGAGTAAFVHPGITLSKPDLESLKANLNQEPRKSGYKALEADGHSQLQYKMRGPFETVTRNPHLNNNQWKSDMQAIFDLSLMWYFTEDARYARKSHDILWRRLGRTYSSCWT